MIRRLVILISNQAKLLAQAEASLKQAESATQAARSLLTKSNEDKENQQNDTSETHEKVVITDTNTKLLYMMHLCTYFITNYIILSDQVHR